MPFFILLLQLRQNGLYGGLSITTIVNIIIRFLIGDTIYVLFVLDNIVRDLDTRKGGFRNIKDVFYCEDMIFRLLFLNDLVNVRLVF